MDGEAENVRHEFRRGVAGAAAGALPGRGKMPESSDAIIVILAMTAVTYGLRVAGFPIGARLPRKGRVAAAMNALPGSILIGIVVPRALMTGIAETAAALAVIAAALSGNIVLAMLAGPGSVWLPRMIR